MKTYLRLGAGRGVVVRQIVAANADVILNTINGDTNVAFFRALRAAGVSPEKYRRFLQHFGGRAEQSEREDLAGDYAAGNYFQTIDRRRIRNSSSDFKPATANSGSSPIPWKLPTSACISGPGRRGTRHR